MNIVLDFLIRVRTFWQLIEWLKADRIAETFDMPDAIPAVPRDTSKNFYGVCDAGLLQKTIIVCLIVRYSTDQVFSLISSRISNMQLCLDLLVTVFLIVIHSMQG